jgi:predicted AAA+ superfamily ATPase
MELVNRPRYSDWLRGLRGVPLAKVVTGMRRSGKSSLLDLLERDLLSSDVPANRVLHLNFDQLGLDQLRTASALDQHIAASMPSDGPIHVLLDEIQEVDQWERLVNSLVAQRRVDLYITGSNSKLLSSELATYIAGRYVQIEVLTLGFSEHLAFAKAEHPGTELDQATQFERFLRQGGLPGLYGAGLDPDQARRVVQDVYGSILIRDVLSRNDFRHPDLLERVALFALDNVGNLVSARRIADFLKAQQRAIGHQTVGGYLDALVKTYLLNRARRYDLRGKEVLAVGEKYFPGDHGLVNALLGYNPTRLPGLLESIVWSEAKRRGYQVYVGRLGDQEVDFMAESAGSRVYIQVAATALEPQTLGRELAPLLRLRDSYPKYLVTLDRHSAGNTNGVQHMYLPDFLLQQSW